MDDDPKLPTAQEIDKIQRELLAIVERLLPLVETSLLEPTGKELDDLQAQVSLRMRVGNPPGIVEDTVLQSTRIAASLTHFANYDRSKTSSYDDICDLQRLIELLTGSWLALYFLGVPFVHPWEAVLSFAESTGFPRGASASKAIGDIYRRTRLNADPGGQRSDKPVHVLDFNPLAVSATLEETPGSPLINIARLARFYELLQLRLCIRSSATICYNVAESALRKILRDPIKRSKRVESMWSLLHRCFNDERESESYPNSTLRIVSFQERVELMPGCVLGPTEGVYRTRSHQAETGSSSIDRIGAPGNFVPGELLSNYRARLQYEHDHAAPVDKCSKARFEALCANFY